MSKSVKFGKQGKKGVAGRKVVSYESARGPREYESVSLSSDERAMLEDILYGQPKNTGCVHMTKSFKFGKQGTKDVTERNVAINVKAVGPQECVRAALSKKERLEDLFYEQPMSADRECQVSTVPKVACVRNSAVIAESDNSLDEVDRTMVRACYGLKEGAGHQQVACVPASVGIKSNLKVKKRNFINGITNGEVKVTQGMPRSSLASWRFFPLKHIVRWSGQYYF